MQLRVRSGSEPQVPALIGPIYTA